MNDDAVTSIFELVWSGFYNSERVYEIVTEDLFTLEEIDYDWARTEIELQFASKAEAEMNWPKVTDCDRLNKAFDELENSRIIALQNSGMEPSDAITEMSEIYYTEGGVSSDIEGYCFYHGQDLQAVLTTNELYVAFGAIDGDGIGGVAIGRKIVSVLRRHGLAVEWPETIERSIKIAPIKWQRRLDG